MKRSSKFRLIEPLQPSGSDPNEIRQRVHEAIAVQIREKTGGTIPQQGYQFGADVLDAVIEIVFRTALQEGYFRLPGGFGSLKVQRLKSTNKRLPSGKVIKLSAHRARLRYEEGAAVRELTGMPDKTSYRRKYVRQSKLTPKAVDLAFQPA